MERLTGKVKWFNNKAGYGFITVCDGSEHAAKDIFVHYTSIQVKDAQYKCLIQGEYVEFELTKPERGDHEFHAYNVSGVKGGPLMCETRKQYISGPKQTPRTERKPKPEQDERKPRHKQDERKPRTDKKHRPESDGRDTAKSTADDGFTPVSRRRTKGKA